jgi:peroxiredoxin
MRRIIPLFFILFFTLFIRAGDCFETATWIGKLAPAFALNDVNGKRVALSDYKGRVVLINFWSTKCGPCKAEMPSLNNLFLAYKNDGFIVLAISVDPAEKPVQSFLKDKKIAFPVLMDKDEEIYFDQYGILGLPTSFVIDKDGIVREHIKGEREWDAPDMKKKIEMLLATKKVAKKKGKEK